MNWPAQNTGSEPSVWQVTDEWTEELPDDFFDCLNGFAEVLKQLETATTRENEHATTPRNLEKLWDWIKDGQTNNHELEEANHLMELEETRREEDEYRRQKYNEVKQEFYDSEAEGDLTDTN